MNAIVQKMLAKISSVELLKKHDMLTPEYARKVMAEPAQTLEKLGQVNALSKSLYGPFEIPDKTVNGLFKFAKTQNNIPVGLNPQVRLVAERVPLSRCFLVRYWGLSGYLQHLLLSGCLQRQMT